MQIFQSISLPGGGIECSLAPLERGALSSVLALVGDHFFHPLEPKAFIICYKLI